jgi:hypothetical protein
MKAVSEMNADEYAQFLLSDPAAAEEAVKAEPPKRKMYYRGGMFVYEDLTPAKVSAPVQQAPAGPLRPTKAPYTGPLI